MNCDDFQMEVRSIEISDHPGHLRPAECRNYVVLNGRRCGRSDCEDRGTAEFRQPLEQSAIVRPEVMTPLADAMGFIDYKQIHLRLLDQLLKPGRVATFGGDIDELVVPSLDVGISLHYRDAVKGAVEECSSPHFAAAQRVDLVLH